MSLVDLANAFITQLPETGTGTIILDEITLTTSEGVNVADIISDIRDYLAIPTDSSLQISGLSRSDILPPAEGAPLIIKTGRTTFLSAGMTVKTLNFYLQGTRTKTLELALQTIDFPPGWTLGTSFPSLVTFPELDEHLSHNAFIFFSGATNKSNWPVTSALNETIARGLSYYGEFQLDIGPLTQASNFLTFLGAASIPTDIHIFGTIDLKNSMAGNTLTFPTVKLKSQPLGTGGPFTPFKNEGYDQLTIDNPWIGVRTVEVEVEEREGKYKDVTTELHFAVDLQVT